MSGRLEKTKTPGIYRRGSRYVVTFRDQHGTPRKRSAATLAQARDLKAALAVQVCHGTFQPRQRIRFESYVREWAASYQGRTSRGIRPETLKDYAADLERHAIPYLGPLDLQEIRPRHLKQLAAELAGRGYARETIRCVFAPLRALLATAYEDDLIHSNPAAGLRLAQPTRRQPPRRKALTEPELQQFLNALPPDWRLFFELLAHTGLRIGEAVALHWDDIDLGQRRLHVHRRRYRGRIDTPKSDYGIRTIPISTGLARELWRHRARNPHSQIVFATRTGHYPDPANIRHRILNPTRDRVGLHWLSFHTLRHTCATTLFNHGLNAKQVQTWLGHHSPSFTLATYIHTLPDDLPDPDFLDHITNPKPPTPPDAKQGQPPLPATPADITDTRPATEPDAPQTRTATTRHI